ncbi:MAG: hypothetical protein K8W52_27770 [Deltaproteobacteria bacterium]|nr:hypothetical protein [Deltaproteobacteria bacterium]
MAKGSKVGLVIGAGLAAGALGIVAMVKLGAPAQGRDEARAQLEQWQPAWIAARDCYVGKPRAAADPGDAIAIRTLTGDPPHCAAEVAGLSRPAGVSTGVDEIEQAWADVEEATRALGRTEGKKGPAISKLEAAVAALYAVAGADLPPAAAGKAVTITPLAPGPAVPGSVGMVNVAVRDHMLIGQVDAGAPSGETQLIVRSPTEARVIREAPASARAVPDGSWAAAIESDDKAPADGPPLAIVTAGPVGDNGEVGEGAATVVKGKVAAVLGAIGAGANRAVIVRLDEPTDPVAIVRSTDGGATWQKPVRVPGSGFGLAQADRISGAVDVSWEPPGSEDDPDGVPLDAPGGFWWHVTDPQAAPKPVAVPTSDAVSHGCATGGALWFADDRLALATADGAPVRPIEAAADIRACTKAAVATVAGTRIFRCTGERCDDGMEVQTPEGAGMSGVTDVFDAAGVIYAQQSGDTIAVWRTGVEPEFVRAPADMKLVAVVSWGKQQHLGLLAPDGLHLAPVP